MTNLLYFYYLDDYVFLCRNLIFNIKKLDSKKFKDKLFIVKSYNYFIRNFDNKNRGLRVNKSQ